MYTDFGENLRKLRKSMSLTQSQLGKKCNISGTAISKYESGAVKPSLEVAVDIAHCLNVSLDTLFSTQAKGTLPLQGLTEKQTDILTRLAELLRVQNVRQSHLMTSEQCEVIGKIVAEFAGVKVQG